MKEKNNYGKSLPKMVIAVPPPVPPRLGIAYRIVGVKLERYENEVLAVRPFSVTTSWQTASWLLLDAGTFS